MVRRTLVLTFLVAVVLALATAPASAYVPLVGHTVPPGARLAAGADPAVAVWPADGGTRLVAQRFAPDGGPQPARTLASGIGALSGWYAAGDGPRVTVVWKDGATVSAACVDVSDGSTVFGPLVVCTDAAVAALDGGATAAALAGAAPDGAGGAYVWLTVAPSRGVAGFGDSLLNRISAAGTLAVPDPGLAVARGTIAALDADDAGHAFALLAPPGRNGMGTQRFSPALTPDTGWSKPIQPYNPLLPVPNATPTAIAITAGSGATIAWREGARVKVQRYPAAGGVEWLTPPAVTLAGGVRLAADGAGGAYLAGPSASGVAVCHVLASGAVSVRAPDGLGLGAPTVGSLATNRAGDLFIGYGDAAAPGAGGVALLTSLGDLTAVGPETMQPDAFTAAVADGCGGAYLLGDTAGTGYLWRVAGGPGLFVTLRPRAEVVLYGKSVTVGGYVTQGSLPVSGASVTLATASSGAGSPPAAVQTGADGYYRVGLSPKANATWTATTPGGASDGVLVQVRPKVTMTLSHLRSGRLGEIFTGSVAPSHRGKRVLVQKAVGSGWKTVASGRLDSRSRYRVVWYVPYRTATYKLRVILPAHGDHAQGTSPTGALKVVIRKA